MPSDINITLCSPYSFGFNGKENDNEVFGAEGTFQDYGMRCYDIRVGRFFSVDPLTADYPWYTPYQFAGNKSIQAVDLDGKEEEHYSERFNSFEGKVVLRLGHV
jgi:RHS repeat-associated protein